MRGWFWYRALTHFSEGVWYWITDNRANSLVEGVRTTQQAPAKHHLTVVSPLQLNFSIMTLVVTQQERIYLTTGGNGVNYLYSI